jgi:hypothetical protein
MTETPLGKCMDSKLHRGGCWTAARSAPTRMILWRFLLLHIDVDEWLPCNQWTGITWTGIAVELFAGISSASTQLAMDDSLNEEACVLSSTPDFEGMSEISRKFSKAKVSRVSYQIN